MELELGCKVAFGVGKTGIVRFVGETDFANGEWVGIELERPEGKNNGELNGRECPEASQSSAIRRKLQFDASAVHYGVFYALYDQQHAQLSLDTTARQTTPGGSEDQLTEARARISRLEEELEQKNRHVEQLRQSVSVMKEAASANSDKIKALEEREQENTEEGQTTEGHQEEDEQMEEAMDVDEDVAAEEEEDSGLSAQEELAQQIESIKEEAEEHVRLVRAELEDHITELQTEHEELLDELRLENATQASEIKVLEAEVAQQKARIVTFTAAEQKKAEEVAIAVAKSSSGARKVDALEKQLAELQDMIEMMTLEKETVEMDKEIAEEHAEELQQEVEKLKAALALSASAGPEPSEGSSSSSGDLADENRKLRAAVKTLHERGSEEKAELSKKLRQAQRENAELVAMREEVEELTTKRNKLESEAEELKEMLDVANAYETMVEDLTEKNLTLGEKVAELETTVQSLESLREVDQEMEHQHTEYEAELRDEIDSQRASLQELKQAVLDKKTVLEDKERTIARFRDLAHGHREEIGQLKAKLRAESGAVESLKGTAHLALNQTMGLRALVASAREHETEAAKQKIIAEQARLENSFLRAVVPNSIFSETDQKVLRVRLMVGRIAGKSDILLQHLKKDVDGVLQQPSSGPQDDENEDAATASAVSVEQLVLGGKLAAVASQAKEDLFMLECHLTTEEEFAQGCAALDTSQTAALESMLDSALSAISEGTLVMGSRGGGDGASLYDRLVQTSEEWHTGRITQVASAVGAESFAARCAVVKLRSRKNVAKLAFSISAVVMFLRNTKTLLTGPEMPDDAQTAALRTELVPVLDKCLEELLSALNVAQLFYRRAEIDLASSDDDLDGLVAVGGDAVASIQSYAAEALKLSGAVQAQLAHSGILEYSTTTETLVQFMQQSVLDPTMAFKERLASLFKLVCRGAFTDAVAPRTRSDHTDGSSGRPQWRIRAQAIHQELLDASTLRVSLAEMTELCNALHQRIREFERADSQHRVVAQKLESQLLQLTENVATMNSEKTQLEAQLSKEREQFDVALDESNKEKSSLNTLNRELRKQLKRSSDAGASAKSSSGVGGSGKGSAMSGADADAFRRAFQQLHGELHKVRSTLAKERLEKLLNTSLSTGSSLAAKPSDRLTSSLKEVATFSRQMKAQLSMPRLVDLKQAASPTGTSAHSQLMTEKLQQSRAQRDLAALRERVGTAMRDDGWGQDVTSAITRGESVFGWQPPEMERPPVLLGRVKLGSSAASAQSVQLVLNRSEMQHLSKALLARARTLHFVLAFRLYDRSIPTTDMGIGASSTRHWDGSIMPSQKGKLVIVTGANCGIGYEAAKALALRGAFVVLGCRDESHGRQAEQSIRQSLLSQQGEADGGVEFMQLDLAELTSVRDFARAFRVKFDRLDLLVNNAGVACPPQRHNSKGLENTFAINHLGHFYLTSLLWGLLRRAKTQARVVNVSSGLHHYAKLDFATMGHTPGNSIRDYAESKMANVLFTYELQRRLRDAGIANVIAVVVHPGVCHTEIWNKYIRTKLKGWQFLQWLAMWAVWLLPFLPQKIGALPTLYAATVESVRGGEMYAPNGLMTLRGYPALDTSHPASHSLDNAIKLWKLSEDMLDAKFEVVE
ncbi:hypothetical protein BBJ29_001833 [Phytophthora kernoviae]|uniref:CAP-Gly domain-containing protein n=1 Tax=Phytophthora kernoviae TaxID=325452 RepID=A0A3F2RR56_9STRA|nr:hypothetical protein BBJ29_001833 [Phytophthora kernoviae]RLN62623.1 hypothetical protein BBP00_00004641 [Phytophthora kernoviae]